MCSSPSLLFNAQPILFILEYRGASSSLRDPRPESPDPLGCGGSRCGQCRSAGLGTQWSLSKLGSLRPWWSPSPGGEDVDFIAMMAAKHSPLRTQRPAEGSPGPVPKGQLAPGTALFSPPCFNCAPRGWSAEPQIQGCPWPRGASVQASVLLLGWLGSLAYGHYSLCIAGLGAP